MNTKKHFRAISALVVFVLLLSLFPTLPLRAEAVEINLPITADPAAWGTQGNNGWYYMYRLTDGSYHEMNFYEASDGIDWRKNAFASDLSTTVEMFFINQSAVFFGENGTRPVYAYRAPESGDLTLRMQTHSTEQMHMQVYVGDSLQKIGGEDSLTLTTTGTLPGGMTLTEVLLTVKKGQMIYVEFYSTDLNAQRQAWINEYAVIYHNVSEGDEEDLTGHTFEPEWGTQGTNGWYYMYQHGNTGQYGVLDYFDETAAIDWQRNHYAFDPYVMGEMLFIDPVHFFTGELGSKPVYAFRAPATGKIRVDFEIHGLPAMGVSAFVEDEAVRIEGKDRYTFTTDGPLTGAFTAVSLETYIEKGNMLYLVCSTTDSGVRDGWLRSQRATYLSMEQEPDYTETTLTPNPELWGAESNNCWNYQYLVKDSSIYQKLTYYPADATQIDWQKDTYSFDPGVMNEMLFISKTGFFVGENGTRPVYTFRAPIGGEVEFTVRTHGMEQMYLEVYRNEDLVQIDGADRIAFTTTGTLPGGFTETKFTLAVKKNTEIHLVGGSSDISASRDGFVNYYAAQYLTTNDDVEVPPVIVKPKVEGPALDWNKTTAYYAALQEKLRGDEPMTWLFVGDSITANDGDVTKGFRCYAEIFESYLKGTLGRVNDRVVNTAVSGWKVSNINFERDIAAYDPDVVYVKIGTNDSFANEYAAGVFLQNMETLYGKIEASGAIPIVACANGFSHYWGNVSQTQHFAEFYPDAIRTLAHEKNLLLVDYYSVYAEDAMFADDHYFNPDTIHPNREGMLVHAQTLLRDLGMDAGGPILTQNAADLSACEPQVPMILTKVQPGDYLSAGSAVKFSDVDLNAGFYLLGGVDAIGANKTLITRRSLPQYLNNNLQLGRGVSRYISPAEATSLDMTSLEADKAIILLPEAYGRNGEPLWANVTADALAELANGWIGAGRAVVLVTPAPVFGEAAAQTAALAEAVRTAAKASGAALIDLNGYFAAIAELDERAKTVWYDGAQLNFAGVNDAAILLGTAFGLDTVSFSDNYFAETFAPEKWGAQGENNFFYLYEAKGQAGYKELPFVPAPQADAVWTADRFSLAANDFTFIGKDVLHAGAAYNPVKAFRAPFSGTVRVTVKHRRGVEDVTEGGTNGTIWIKAKKNDEALTFDGDVPQLRMLAAQGSYTVDTLTVDVEKDDWIYLIVDAENPGQGDVIEKVTYLSLKEPEQPPVVLENPFIDVKEGDFYYDAVLWAVNAQPQVTAGTSATTFEPNATCTRAQVVTFLWRAKGCPEPKSTNNPFTDVKGGEYYYKAVLWAVENNITAGTSATTFSPNAGCTRAQVVTFLWRTEGQPKPTSSANPFKDVTGGYYYDAVLWAVEKKITAGTSATTFSPDNTCTRGQIVTFLARALQTEEEKPGEIPQDDLRFQIRTSDPDGSGWLPLIP